MGHNHCKDDHCCSHDHGDSCCSHDHHHHCCGDHHEHQACYTDEFLELADEAWMEVLKEKIKENIRTNDTRINELAQIISEANHQRWKKKMDGKHCQESFKQKLHDYFEGDCCKK